MRSDMDFVYFLGRFHVLLLHLPIGILTLAIVFELLVRFRPFRFLEPVVSWTWLAGGISGVATVILGFMHATESGFQDSPAVEAHRWAGITLTALGLLIFVLRLRLPKEAPAWARGGAYQGLQPLWAAGGPLDRMYAKAGWILACAATFVMLFITGHLGGNLTHGETYLVQYAPTPIRRLAGLSAETDPRAPPKDLASADLYLDIVAPALHSRCDACHNDGKKSGGFSLANYDALMKGGKEGPVIVPGAPDKSNLFHRISLGPSDKDFMPKDGKTPLTAEQTAAVQVWIKAGAPKSGLVGTIKLAATDKAILSKALPGGAGAAPAEDADAQGSALASGEPPLPAVPEADKLAVAKVVDDGFIVRKVYKGSNLLDVDYASPRPVTPEMIADLTRFAPNILRLNLRRAGITDAEVKTIVTFRNLRHLRLEKNAITDAGARDIATLKDLISVNLTNTKVTDQGFAAVAQLPKLQRLYVWGAAVTPAAADKVKAQRKGLELDMGVAPKDVPTKVKIVPPDL
jgi:uncharacterized membrane protein